MDLIDENFVAKLESEENALCFDWLVSRLVKEMRWQRERTQEETRPGADKCKYNNREELDKLFEVNRDTEAVRDLNVKHLLLNRALDELRPHMKDLSATTISATVRKFCFGDFADIGEHGMEMYDFLMEFLESKPPLFEDRRWFWMCVVTGRHGDANHDVQLRDTVTDFSDKCVKFFKSENRPYEFLLFLLNLLEYDYAALFVRHSGDEAKLNSSSSSSSLSVANVPIARRNLPLNSMTDVDRFPLAYLLLCRVSPTTGITEIPELFNVLRDLLMLFNAETQTIHLLRLYARLLGLLLDVLLFVELGAHPYIRPAFIDDIPQKVLKLLRKMRIQFGDHKLGENDAVWALFVDMAGVPWIRELACTISFENLHTPMLPRRKRAADQ